MWVLLFGALVTQSLGSPIQRLARSEAELETAVQGGVPQSQSVPARKTSDGLPAAVVGGVVSRSELEAAADCWETFENTSISTPYAGGNAGKFTNLPVAKSLCRYHLYCAGVVFANGTYTVREGTTRNPAPGETTYAKCGETQPQFPPCYFRYDKTTLTGFANNISTQFATLNGAKQRCDALFPACAGVVYNPTRNTYTVRSGPVRYQHPNETTWAKCGRTQANVQDPVAAVCYKTYVNTSIGGVEGTDAEFQSLQLAQRACVYDGEHCMGVVTKKVTASTFIYKLRALRVKWRSTETTYIKCEYDT